MNKSTTNRIPEDVKQVCLWLVRGYQRRKHASQESPSPSEKKAAARERERVVAVEQALAAVGADIPSEEVRKQLRAAILLNVESGRANPYERLGVDAVGRAEFYRRRDRLLADIASYLGMA